MKLLLTAIQVKEKECEEHYCHSPMYVFMLFLNTMKTNVKMHCINQLSWLHSETKSKM